MPAKPATKSQATSPKPPGALATPLQPSAELAAVIGSSAPISRSAVVTEVWRYIRAHGLQDPVDRRQIRADDALRPLFGSDALNMFELAKVLSRHLAPVPATG